MKKTLQNEAIRRTTGCFKSTPFIILQAIRNITSIIKSTFRRAPFTAQSFAFRRARRCGHDQGSPHNDKTMRRHFSCLYFSNMGTQDYLLSFYYLYWKKFRKWLHSINVARPVVGAFATLNEELRSDGKKFINCFRMKRE